MKNILICLLALTSLPALTAQTENIWLGGFPGQEHDWDVAQNWSLQRIPNEFDLAVIPDCSGRGGFYPIVWIEQQAVKGLRLLSGAELTIAQGAILVVDSGGDPEDSGVLLQGFLRNDGRFIVVSPSGTVHVTGY